jgi:hypothetical protein
VGEAGDHCWSFEEKSGGPYPGSVSETGWGAFKTKQMIIFISLTLSNFLVKCP